VEYVIPSRFNNVPGIEKLAQLCAEKGGREVKQVVSVDGYFDQNEKNCSRACWLGVSASPLNYLEIKVEEPESFHFIKEPGIWKIYKTAIDDPNCHPKIKRFMQQRRRHHEFVEKQCIAIKKLDEADSQYGVSLLNNWIYLSNEYKSKILEQSHVIYDLSTTDVIARQAFYLLYPKHSKLDPAWAVDCSSIGIKTFEGSLRSAVLKAR